MQILIGADVVPTKSNVEYFETAAIEKLVNKELLLELRKADFRIFNLETPLTNVETPIEKCGPNLQASTLSVTGIKALGVDFLTLANNHILDQGEEGLHSTMQVLRENGIEFAGAGDTPEQATGSFMIERDGKKIGIYCCAEHEFSIVTEKSAGANPFDPLESLDHIRNLKQCTDYVIVLYHGGKEHYRYPSPELRRVCRKIVDKGADIVICQHTHCVGCEEKWKDGTIVYGQGNFLFDRKDNEYWNTGLLVQIDIQEQVKIDYLPLVKQGCSVALAVEEKGQILEAFFKRTEQIQQDGFVEKMYEEYSERILDDYLSNGFQGGRYKTIWFRVANKISGYRLKKWLIAHRYKQSHLNYMYDMIVCEAHREAILSGLKGRAVRR